MSFNAGVTIQLRPTTEADLPLLLAWRQNPLVMEHFVDGCETWEEHLRWWQSRDTRSFIILFKGRPVGEVHYSCPRGGMEPIEVGLYIGETTLWGKGIGRQAMALLLEQMVRATNAWAAVASVHPKNRRSQRMFRALGFKFMRVKKDGYLLFRRLFHECSPD